MYRYKVLIVDDDKLMQNSLNQILSEKYDTSILRSGEDAIRFLEKNPIDLVLLDIRLPGMDGIETLELIKANKGDMLVIMMTAYEDIKTVIKSMKKGAYDYLVKPLEIDELEFIIEKALDNLRLKKEVEELRKQYLQEFMTDNIIGESNAIRKSIKFVKTVVKSYDTTVLIEGETGTGKEVIARAIHCQGIRFGKPFVTINCGAISKDLVESEFFGYEKGTFTGGLQKGKKGKFELADGGTIFLDEISELLPVAQVSLLRFLEEKEFYPVGGTRTVKVDVQIIAATNRSLEDSIREGNFREDLYYRLNVAKIILPPLRERKEDIMPLTRFFIDKYNEKFNKNFQRISPEAQNILIDYLWTGNIRELRNAIERVVLMEDGEEVQPVHLAFLISRGSPEKVADFQIPFGGMNLDDLSRSLIVQALERSGRNRTLAAKMLGISRPTMIYRIQKYGINIQ